MEHDLRVVGVIDTSFFGDLTVVGLRHVCVLQNEHHILESIFGSVRRSHDGIECGKCELSMVSEFRELMY
jgi:hypothetical protein